MFRQHFFHLKSILRLKNNNVFIPFKGYDFIGGPSTFMRNLKTYLDDLGYKYKSDISKSKHIFFPISYDLATLKKIKKDKGAIIQRLDGIYYPEKHGASYQEKNKLIKDIYLNYATKVVFQSQYSKAQCFTLFGEKDTHEYEIIINGVNEAIFYPSNAFKEVPKKFKLVTTGNFRNIDMLEPVIKALDTISKFDFELHIIGPIVNDNLHDLINRDYVTYHGTKTTHQIAGLLREHHIFIYSHLNPLVQTLFWRQLPLAFQLLVLIAALWVSFYTSLQICWQRSLLMYFKNMKTFLQIH